MDNRHLTLHMISNILAGFAFFGVSYYFLLFTITHNKRFKENKYFDVESAVILLKKNSYLILNISAVFWFCGLGHILEAFSPWMTNSNFIVVEHWINAFFGVLLCFNLSRLFSK